VTAVVLLVGFAGAPAHAGEKGEKEPIAIIELGGTGEWTFTGKTSFEPSAAVEFEPIKDWLEIEIGTGPPVQQRPRTLGQRPAVQCTAVAFRLQRCCIPLARSKSSDP
jgi:hypothetical protein